MYKNLRKKLNAWWEIEWPSAASQFPMVLGRSVGLIRNKRNTFLCRAHAYDYYYAFFFIIIAT